MVLPITVTEKECGRLTLDANVAVQRGRDQSTHDRQSVSGRAQAVHGDTQVRGSLDILTLEAIDEEAVEHVADVDEELGTPHALQEVTRTLDLGHEFREDHGSTICIDGLHHTVDRGAEVALVGKASAMGDSGEGAVDRCDQFWVDGVAGRGGRGGVQRRRIGGSTHGNEHDGQVNEDSGVGQPAELLQRPNLTQGKAGQGPHETAHGVTELELGCLRQRFSIGDDDDSNVAQKLNSLQEVHGVAADRPIDAIGNIAVCQNGELEGIKICINRC